MIKTNNTPCTYEELYYEMWETAGRYSKITRFQVIGSSHDERMIPAVWVGNGNQTVFCIAGMIGTDRHMPGYLVEMMKEYTRAWECGCKLEEIYDRRDLFEKWTICFVPILNPDGYEIYENDFLPYVIRSIGRCFVCRKSPAKNLPAMPVEQNSGKISLPAMTGESRSTSSLQVKMKRRR